MVDIAWAAGLFEGEGTIVVRKARLANREKSDTVDVQLSSVDEDVVRAFCEVVGTGKVYGPYGPYQENRQVFWKWCAYGAKAQSVLERLLPYLCKRRHARALEALSINGTEYCNDGGAGDTPAEEEEDSPEVLHNGTKENPYRLFGSCSSGDFYRSPSGVFFQKMPGRGWYNCASEMLVNEPTIITPASKSEAKRVNLQLKAQDNRLGKLGLPIRPCSYQYAHHAHEWPPAADRVRFWCSGLSHVKGNYNPGVG